jgi:hypothetical protein
VDLISFLSFVRIQQQAREILTMAVNRKSGSLSKDLQTLKQQNAALEKQVKELRAERDSYVRALHGWAKERISKEDLKKWMAEEKLEGSLMEFIHEIEQRKS